MKFKTKLTLEKPDNLHSMKQSDSFNPELTTFKELNPQNNLKLKVHTINKEFVFNKHTEQK